MTTPPERMVSMETFEAQTQYGDWKGTASADEYGDGDVSFEQVFEVTGKVNKETEILIGFEFSAGEDSFFLYGYYHPKSLSPDIEGTIPALDRQFKRDSKPIQVKRVTVELTQQEFFKRLKRFRVVLVDSGLKIVGREYEITSEV
jgi:hypothetical protein